jgi:hypothetical protein
MQQESNEDQQVEIQALSEGHPAGTQLADDPRNILRHRLPHHTLAQRVKSCSQ